MWSSLSLTSYWRLRATGILEALVFAKVHTYNNLESVFLWPLQSASSLRPASRQWKTFVVSQAPMGQIGRESWFAVEQASWALEKRS